MLVLCREMTLVWFHIEGFAVLAAEAARMLPMETGGILIGYWGSPDEAVVTEVVGPGPNAKHGADYFIPDGDFHSAEVARLYVASGRRHVYLGDWHTHPNGGAYLSCRDRRTLGEIARHGPSRLRTPLMAVLGTAAWELMIWRLRPARCGWWAPREKADYCEVRFYP